MYTPGNVFENRAHPAVIHWTPTNPCERTGTLPGTREKVVVMAERLRRGQPLWHADDPTMFGVSRGTGVPTILSVVATSFVTSACLARE